MAATYQEKRELAENRMQSYRAVFAGIRAEVARADLERFCRANESTFHPDPRIEGILQGRREVWLRIEQYLTLSPDELLAVFDPAGVVEKGDEDDG